MCLSVTLLRFENTHYAAAIGRDIETGESTGDSEPPHCPGVGLICHERTASHHVVGDHDMAVGAAIEELAPIAGPDRINSAVTRHLPLSVGRRALRRKWRNVHVATTI